MKLPEVLSSEEVQYNWDDWNTIRNTYNLHVINNNLKYPKYLIIRGWKWFCEWAKIMHVDINFYKYIEVSKHDYLYTLSFYDHKKVDGNCIYLGNIYYDSRNKKILQAEFYI
jgi:hypothetical protein